VGRNTVVGIETSKRLDGPGIAFRWGEIFSAHVLGSNQHSV